MRRLGGAGSPRGQDGKWPSVHDGHFTVCLVTNDNKKQKHFTAVEISTHFWIKN